MWANKIKFKKKPERWVHLGSEQTFTCSGTRTHTDTHFCSNSTPHWTVSKEQKQKTHTHKTTSPTHLLQLKETLHLLLLRPLSLIALAQYSLSVSCTGWLAGPPLYSCSQSVSRTNAPALLASGLCSSAMQQHAHARTHTPNTQKFHKHTHSPHPPSLSFCSQRLTLIQCWVYLPTLLAGGVLRECVRQKVCLRAGVGGGQTVGGVRENTSQRTLICRGRRWVEGRVEDTQGSCIPTDTEEGFLLQPCKRWEKKRGGKKTERARASYFSDVESACAWDVCVYRVGNISRPCSYLQKALFIKRELRPCRLKSNQRRKFSWFVLKGLTSWSE